MGITSDGGVGSVALDQAFLRAVAENEYSSNEPLHDGPKRVVAQRYPIIGN